MIKKTESHMRDPVYILSKKKTYDAAKGWAAEPFPETTSDAVG